MNEFTWRDGERTIRFGRGTAATLGEIIEGPYVLITTPRAEGLAAEDATAVLHLLPGEVGDAAAALLEQARGDGWLVALGGGRVIDATKALGAATGRPVAAIPTTLSAAEMTRGGRPVAGLDPPPPNWRPRVVVNDPALSASQPPDELAGSAANALAHAVEGPVTRQASPVPILAGREAARLIGVAYEGDEPDRDALALGALLSGYAIDGPGYGLHHVLAQTVRGFGRISHAQANAVLLPHTMRALERRFGDLGAPVSLAERLAALAGASHLADLGVDDATLDRCADAAARRRADLENTPPPPDRDELREILAAAR